MMNQPQVVVIDSEDLSKPCEQIEVSSSFSIEKVTTESSKDECPSFVSEKAAGIMTRGQKAKAFSQEKDFVIKRCGLLQVKVDQLCQRLSLFELKEREANE